VWNGECVGVWEYAGVSSECSGERDEIRRNSAGREGKGKAFGR